MIFKTLRLILPLSVLMISCKNEIGNKQPKTNQNDTIYSATIVDTSTSGVKETLLQKVDGVLYSRQWIKEDYEKRLSRVKTKGEANELYEQYFEEMERGVEYLNELEADLLANYAHYYEHEKDQYVFPDSLQQHIDLFKNTDLEFWEVGEGNTEIRYKPYHYYSLFKGKVSEDYETFLKIEAKENTVLYRADAGLLISFEDLGTRVLNWENFRNEYTKSPLYDRATTKYQEYGYTYLMGLENTSTFDYETGSLDEESKKEFKRFINKNPNSNFAQIIKRLLVKVKENASYDDLEEFVHKELNIVVEKEPDTP